jgi:acetyl esterase/lipase
MGQPGRGLAAAGFVAVAVETRGRPDPTTVSPGGFSWPAQLDDVQRAVRWIRANATRFGIDPVRIGAYGEATGGHLAAMLGLRDTRDEADPALAGHSSRVACVVDLGGPVDFGLLHTEERHEAFVEAFLGGPPEAAAGAYRDASPLSWIDDTAAPFLIVQGGRDAYVEPPQGRRLASALDEAGTELVYAALPLASQAAVTNWEFVDSFALPFLARHLKPDD